MTRRLAFAAGALLTAAITAAGLVVLAVFALADRELDLDDQDVGGAWLDQCPSEALLSRDLAPVRCQQHTGHSGGHHAWHGGVCTEWPVLWDCEELDRG